MSIHLCLKLNERKREKILTQRISCMISLLAFNFARWCLISNSAFLIHSKLWESFWFFCFSVDKRNPTLTTSSFTYNEKFRLFEGFYATRKRKCICCISKAEKNLILEVWERKNNQKTTDREGENEEEWSWFCDVDKGKTSSAGWQQLRQEIFSPQISHDSTKKEGGKTLFFALHSLHPTGVSLLEICKKTQLLLATAQKLPQVHKHTHTHKSERESANSYLIYLQVLSFVLSFELQIEASTLAAVTCVSLKMNKHFTCLLVCMLCDDADDAWIFLVFFFQQK